ncbi:MAG TPA: hypothetical protein VFE28_13860 [Candidatus Krumholzibacteria bacterium]|nr:hypothetical protein [Candidatus Krumholzibacteria bacterium]
MTFVVRLLFTTLLCTAGIAQNTELHSCLPDTSACVESEGVPVSSCGVFWFHRGYVSWAPLRAVGPITIALETYDGSSFGNVLPLYVEIKGYADSLGCTPEGAGQVIFITRSLDTCGGVWESVGPVEITRFTPLGSFYRIQVAFLQAYPPHWDIRSPALRCIRVTVAPDAIASTSWSNLKILFR